MFGSAPSRGVLSPSGFPGFGLFTATDLSQTRLSDRGSFVPTSLHLIPNYSNDQNGKDYCRKPFQPPRNKLACSRARRGLCRNSQPGINNVRHKGRQQSANNNGAQVDSQGPFAEHSAHHCNGRHIGCRAGHEQHHSSSRAHSLENQSCCDGSR